MSDVYIGFRSGDWEHLEEFLKAVDDLGVDKTELAKRAISCGLKEAKAELKAEQAEKEKREKRVQDLLKVVRGERIERSTPTVSRIGKFDLMPEFA